MKKILLLRAINIFATVSLLCFASTSFAKSPDYCFGYQNIQFVSLPNQELKDLYSCTDLKPFDELGGKINDLLTYKNPGVDVIMSAHMSESSDSHVFDHLTFSIEQKSPEDLRFTNTIFVHEWSHAILNRYLQDNLPMFKNFLPLRTHGEEIEKTIFQFLQLVDDNGACSSAQCQQFYTQNSKVFISETENSKAMNSFFNSKPIFTAISAHYQELFADFVPALYYSNLDIARQANSHFFDYLPDSAHECRSFLFSAPVDFKISDPHCSLSVVRKQIGAKMQNATTMSEKQLLARKFMALMAQQIELQSQRVSGWTEQQLKEFPDAKAITDLTSAVESL